MKTKTIFLLSFFLSIGLNQLSAQTLQKGTLIGFHNAILTPNPDITMNQLVNFIKIEFIPEYEKNFPGSKVYLIKGIRGECQDCIYMLIIFPSDEVRSKYWNKDGTQTEIGKVAVEKMIPVQEEAAKFGKMVDKYTDFEIL